MEKLEVAEDVVKRLFDPKRQNKYISQEAKKLYIQHILEANWEKICGPNLCSRCCIHKLEKNTLIIRTESSVWANHLLMMKDLFLQKINAYLLGSLVIKDLKFYSGGVIKRYEAKAQQIADIKQDEQKEVAICSRCGAQILTGGRLCNVCDREEREELKGKIAELLRLEPWLNYENCLKYYKCDKILFTAVRDQVQNSFFEKVRLGRASENDCLMAVMFLTGKRPDEIDDKAYANTLEYLRRDQSVPAFRVGLHGKKQRNYRDI